LLAPPAIAQRDGDSAFGVGLANYETVEFGDDFARREVHHVLEDMLDRLGNKRSNDGRPGLPVTPSWIDWHDDGCHE
jgi:hypothetical protein